MPDTPHYSSWKSLVTTALVLVAISSFAACADEECTTLLTYNTALLPRIDKYEDRRKVLPKAVIDQDADVICLQEVWFEQDVHDIISAARSDYPYHFSYLHTEVGDGPEARQHLLPKSACTPIDALYFNTKILPCAILKGCIGQFQVSFPIGHACATSRCGKFFNSPKIRPECTTCATVSATSLLNLLGGCTQELRGRDNRLNDAGLLLLSKRPLSKVKYQSFFPGRRMSLPRAYIQAEIEGLPPTICTHVSSLFPGYFEYDLPFEDHDEQQDKELDILTNIYGTDPHIVIGDFNIGPRAPDGAGDAKLLGTGSTKFDALLALGYSSPYVDQDGRCTYCISNDIANGIDTDAIDHVLFMAPPTSTITSQRVLDTTTNGIFLSDHFAVQATICTS